MITGRQVRAARAFLGWDAEELAEKAGLSRDTVFNIENGTTQARGATIEKIVNIFNSYGLEFLPDEGVKKRSAIVGTYEGPKQFDAFYDFLYDHLRKNGGDVCLSISDQGLLAKHRSNPSLHYERMKDLHAAGKIKPFRILASKSEHFENPMFSVFRLQPANTLSPTGFWAFGDCLALISFAHDPAPYVVVLQSAPLAAAYRQAFDVAWDVAKEVPNPKKVGAS